MFKTEKSSVISSRKSLEDQEVIKETKKNKQKATQNVDIGWDQVCITPNIAFIIISNGNNIIYYLLCI